MKKKPPRQGRTALANTGGIAAIGAEGKAFEEMDILCHEPPVPRNVNQSLTLTTGKRPAALDMARFSLFRFRTGDSPARKTGSHMYRRMTCHEIYAYWDKLRGAEKAPLRGQIEPAALRHALPDLFMLEIREDGDLAFRLVGTRMCALFGRELRGHSFHELWAGGRSSIPMEIARGTIHHESPALMNVTGFFEDGESRRFDMPLLPVRSSENQCDRLLGALVPAAGEEKKIVPQTLQCLLMDRSRPLKATGEGLPASPRSPLPQSSRTNG